MKEENDKRVYCSNMDEDDPIIEKFMKEYLKKNEETGKVQKSDDLIVNFDITYADGKSESYTCNNESDVFGNVGKDKEQSDKRGYYSDKNNIYDTESEIGKWANCVDEWCECNSKENVKKEDCKKKETKNKEVNKEKYECEGKITVYSILSLSKSTTLKGVTVNLYRINGVKPELVQSRETDKDGMAVFQNVKEGNYRIIQLIDKRYFEKPVYLTWNEVNITSDNKEYVLYVLNSLKNYRKN